MSTIVIVDPLSTGAAISERACERGLKVIRLWSHECPDELRSHVPLSFKPDTYAATLSHVVVSGHGPLDEACLAQTSDALRALTSEDIAAIVCGCDTGVTLTNALSEHMNLRGNPCGDRADLHRVRSNKYYQSEAVRAAGHRAVKQALASSEDMFREFITQLAPSPFQVFLKPVESAGSDDCKLCTSMEDAVAHFRYVLGKEKNALGRKNEAVLVQEYLVGTEYIVDFVSRDGCHKCVAVWEYDKREANGGSAVYFGEIPLGGDHPLVKQLADYTKHVLDACGVSNGSTHSEVIVSPDGDLCLVECNCRTNGGDGLWVPVAEALYGFSQVGAMLDAFLDAPAFDALPSIPAPLKQAGVVGHIVSYQQGILKSAPGIEDFRALPSYRSTALCFEVGDMLPKTVDFMTDAGVFLLVHSDPKVLENDYARAHELVSRTDFFKVEGTPEEVSIGTWETKTNQGYATREIDDTKNWEVAKDTSDTSDTGGDASDTSDTSDTSDISRGSMIHRKQHEITRCVGIGSD